MARCSSRIDTCFKKVKTALLNTASRYGQFVGSHPVAFIVLPILVCGGLSLGIMDRDRESNGYKLYNPDNSRTTKDVEVLYKLFGNRGVSAPLYITFLFESRTNIFSKETITEIRNFVSGFKSFLDHNHMCARYFPRSECIVSGEHVLSERFLSDMAAGKIYLENRWNATGELKDLKDTIAIWTEDTNGKFLVSAKLLKIDFRSQYSNIEDMVLPYIQNFTLKHARLNFKLPHSVDKEMEDTALGEIWMFGATIVLCSIFAIVVTAGGNPVSTRGLLACAGIMAAAFSVTGSMGLLCFCGVKYVDLVGVLPFLIVGTGVDDMFLIMSSWSETLDDKEMTVSQRLGVTMAKASIGITITSLTNCLAFAVGMSSVFLSVRNFSIYISVAVLFSYLTNITLFAGCLALHGRRVYASRHFLTCRVTKPRQDLLNEGRNPCIAWCCGGSPPDHIGDDLNFCDKIPRRVLPRIFRGKSVCVLSILGFLGFLGVTSYGASQLEIGLKDHFLVKESSYVYRTLILEEEYFSQKLAISFIVKMKGTVDYSGKGMRLLDLLQQARKDPEIQPHFEHCWFSAYRGSTFYNVSDPNSVENMYKFRVQYPEFRYDVGIDYESWKIIAFRCSVLSTPMKDQYAMAKLMERMRALADSFPLPVFAYNWTFFKSDTILSVLPATLKLVGCAGAIVFVITFLILPHPYIVFLVVLTGAMIIIGVFGCMYYWGIMLSNITMIHLIMSVGFSVDFATHVCAAYLLSSSQSRADRTEDAIRHAASPIFNGAFSTVTGVLLLSIADSYIFYTFFKVMFLVIMLGLLHAILFLPAVLSLFGPVDSDESSSAKKELLTESSSKSPSGSDIPLHRGESSTASKEESLIGSSSMSPSGSEIQLYRGESSTAAKEESLTGSSSMSPSVNEIQLYRGESSTAAKEPLTGSSSNSPSGSEIQMRRGESSTAAKKEPLTGSSSKSPSGSEILLHRGDSSTAAKKGP